MATRHLDTAVLALARCVRMLVSIIKQSAIGHEMQAREQLPHIIELLREAEGLLVGEAQTRAQLN